MATAYPSVGVAAAGQFALRHSGRCGAVLALTLALLAAPISAVADPVSQIVFLDPGHSGVSDSSITRQVPNGRGGTKDCQTTGTSTDGGFAEHSFNWDVVLLVRDLLEKQGVRTVLSRDSDSGFGPCVDQRAVLANSVHPDAIVSIHADGGPAWGHGFHVNYSAPPLNPAQAGPAVDLARVMRDALVADGLQEADYIGAGGLYGRADLAGLNLADYPAVLVEMGNMRNAGDAPMMESPDGRAHFAQAVSQGILAYLAKRSSTG